VLADLDMLDYPRATIDQTVGCRQCVTRRATLCAGAACTLTGTQVAQQNNHGALLQHQRVARGTRVLELAAISIAAMVVRFKYVRFSAKLWAGVSPLPLLRSRLELREMLWSHTCASLLALMRSASSLCVHSVVNSASLADDEGILPVRVWTVLELTRPSRTCSTRQVLSVNLAGKLKRGTCLVEQGDECWVFLSERLGRQVLNTN
jgi:hypothetical protein